ncbi:hypothetical protein NFI96_015444 [Prochilodus magdalenae]|nr:hypothetical protein NFI96_015444 [Prochilodus magdalenae]
MFIFLFQLYFNSTLCIVLFMRYSLDAFFTLNIISRFYIGFEKHGVVITDLQQVRRAYLKTWFIVDLFSVLPLETLKFAFPSLHFLHFNRCLRVLRLFNIISYFSNEPETNKIYVEILKSFAIVVICVQFSACIWFNQACVAVYDGRPRHCPKIHNWLTLLPETNMTETTDLQYYSVALYWSIITFTTVGYGDIYAKNTDEAVIAVVVMVIGMVVFHGIVLSGMSSIIANLDSRRGRFCRRIKAICLHMVSLNCQFQCLVLGLKLLRYLCVFFLQLKKKTELPEDIQMQVLKSYRYLWKTQKDMNVVEMFDDLPLALHLDVSSARFKTLMTHCPFLKGTDDIFRRALSLKFKTQTFSPGHILARPGDIHTNVYYIEHGQVEVFGDQNAKIDTLLPGSLFGELSLLHKIPRNVTVRTATLCEITVLESKDLHDLFDDYPAACDMMMDVARNRLQNTELPIQEVFAPRVASEPHDVVSVNRKCFWKNTIYPDSAFAKIWTEVVLWSIIFSVFIHIWVLFFTNNDETVGYLSALPKIFERYKASRNLYYDVLAIVPFELLALTEEGTDRWRFFGYCRCNRLIWLRKIYLYFHEKENDVEQNTLKQRAVKCFLLLLFSVHCCSGVLYISACTIFRCDENSWAWNAGLKATMSNFYHYIIAAYFSTTTMTTTGYGDIVPTRMSERVASTVVAFVGLFVFNYIVSQSYAALSSENAARVAFQDLLSSMSLFMEQHDLSISLKNRVIEYMSLLWTNYQGQAHPRGPFLMHDLPVGIRQTILMKERGELLSKIAFFEPAGEAFIGHLASSSMLYYFPRGEIIQYRKTISRELFCVRRGVCQVLCDDLSEIVETFGEGMYFGEAGFLYARPALMTVRAETCCEILVIDFEKVKPILERYPALKSQIEKFQTNLQYYDNLVQERDKMMSRKCENVDEPGVSQEKDDSFEQTPCSRKSKCYIEDFGNFPIYAGAEEETKLETNERRVLPQRPRTVKGQLENFFTSVFLMRSSVDFTSTVISAECTLSDTVTFSELYAISLYFATATFCVVGFGDIYPYLTSTKIINIFIMIAGVLYYGWLSGASAAMLGSADARRTTFTKKIESMKMFLKSMGITGDLYKKTLQFYVFTWIRTKGIDQHTLFEYLPLSLVGDISTIIYAEVIAKAFGLKIKKPLRTQSVDQELSPLERKLSGKLDQPFFQKTLRRESMEQLESDGGFIRMLARHVRPRLYRVSDVICRHKEYGSEMYFINKGEVDVLAHDEQKVIIKLRAGQYFGECSLLYAEPRAATIRAATNCDLHVLSKKSLDEIVKHYPDVCEQIRRAAEDERSASTERDKEYTEMSEDAMAEEEENETLFRRVLDNILRTHDTTISPENTAYIIYQYLSCLLIIISFWAITCMVSITNIAQSGPPQSRYYPLVFDLDRDIFLFTMIIEYIQMIEIILKFHIGYYDDSGSYISDYKSVFWKYMTRKAGFVYDVICSIPYGFLVLHKMHEMAPITFLPLFLYVRTGHLLRIVTVVVFMRREEQLITTSLMRIRIIKSLVTTLLFVHCAAVCCVAFVTYFGTQSWVKTFDMHSYPDIYRYAVYWTLTTYTTTGYGDVVPQMFREVIFVIFLMILSKMQVIYNTGLLSSTQTNHKLLQVAYEDKLQTLQTYMMNQKIPSSIQNHVVQFYNYKWARTKGIDFETLFKDLPPCMKIEILSKITMKYFLKHRLFTHLSEPFLQHLSAKMVFKSYIAGQCISRRGDREDGMHLIISGKVEHSCSTAPNKDIRYHYAGHLLGVDLLLTPGVCRNTAIAHTYVDTFFLSKASFDEVVSYYPEDWNKLSRGSLSAPCNSRPASQ